jgi:hypothetical protein
MSSLTEQTAMEFTPAFFDDASAAWHANKIRRGHGYVYKCEAVTKAGTPCKHPAAMMMLSPHHLCKMHRHYKPSPPSNTEAHGKSASSSDSA